MRVTVVLTSTAAVLHSTVAFSPLSPLRDRFGRQRVTWHRLDRVRRSGGGNSSRFALKREKDEMAAYDFFGERSGEDNSITVDEIHNINNAIDCDYDDESSSTFGDIQPSWQLPTQEERRDHLRSEPFASTYSPAPLFSREDLHPMSPDPAVRDELAGWGLLKPKGESDDDAAPYVPHAETVHPQTPETHGSTIERVKMTRSISDIRFTNAGTLVLDIPPRGKVVRSMLIGVYLHAGRFAVVGPISRPLVLAVYSGFMGQFMFVNPFVSTHITIGKHTWSLTRKYFGKRISFMEGSTNQLVRASLTLHHGKHSNVKSCSLHLHTKKLRMRKIRLAAGLPLEDQQLLEGVINDYLDHRSCGDSE